MTASLDLAHSQLRLPTFLPDATLGVVRAADSRDLIEAKIQAVVMNVFHLMQKPGSSTIQALGGLHRMAAWPQPIITDSGGFQAYSLIRQNPRFGTLSDQGISFIPEGAERKFQLTPEKSIQLQIAYGADVAICLDDCTHVEANLAEQQASVRRTIQWGRRCKAEFERQIQQRRLTAEQRPRLFGVVQGGGQRELRRACAEALLEIGFDGFGFGGWPLDGAGNLLTDMLAYTRELIPPDLPMHALGVGKPENVVACTNLGYSLFDSAMPTRDARNGRLYAYTADPGNPRFRLTGNWHTYLYIHDKKHIKSDEPISPGCDCHTCAAYSRGYLHHLHRCGETLFFRLATIHNLRFMSRLMELLQQQADADPAHAQKITPR